MYFDAQDIFRSMQKMIQTEELVLYVAWQNLSQRT